MTATGTVVREARPDDSGPRPNRRRTLLIVVAATVAMAVLGTWLLAFSSVFGVRSVEVRGVHLLTPDEVRAAADVPNGTPLVRVDTTAITRRVERLPAVASAQVSTSFPSTVVIMIEERAPVGYVSHGRRARLVDGTGSEYRTVDHPPSGLPHFVVPSGEREHSTAAAVAAVAAALPARLRPELRSIQALDPNSITLVLTGHRLVRWGTADQTGEKARLLPALLRRRPSYVDLTDPGQPFTRR